MSKKLTASGRTERERRARVENLLQSALRHTLFFKPGGSFAEREEPLLNAPGMLARALDIRYGYNHVFPTIAEIARDLNLNDELTRLILTGQREPSAVFLEAVGYERVVLYRRITPAGRAVLEHGGEKKP